MTSSTIESIAASLVREYLNRKGLKTTLQVLDEELPRDEDSISNRQQLMKELHIEKLMKKNKGCKKLAFCLVNPLPNNPWFLQPRGRGLLKTLLEKEKMQEQPNPLKSMIEVIAKDLIGDKHSGKNTLSNGEIGVDTKSRPGSTRSAIKSAPSSRTQYPTMPYDKEETQTGFDGFPIGQQDDADDLLKPDPNFSYPAQRRKPKNNPVTVTSKPAPKVKSGYDDLVIEDSHEGETVLGDGKSGVLQQEEDEDQLPARSHHHRPKSSNKPRILSQGMSGPITNTEDSTRRKFQKPRPLSASKNQRLNLFENESPKLTAALDSPSNTKSSSKPTVVNSRPLNSAKSTKSNLSHTELNSDVKEIETLISSERKQSIKDVLEIEQGRTGTVPRRQTSVEKETKHYTVDTSSIVKDRKKASGSGSQTSSSSSISITKVGDVEVGDIDDLDQDLAKLDVGPRTMSAKINKSQHNCKPIDVKMAVALKTLIFGTPMQCFNDEWRYQSFSFCDMPKLKYGIVQKKGGPCGVLASVQAFVLQELLFGDRRIPLQRFNSPNYEERTEALAIALARIFWRAGEKRKAVVCIPSSRPVIGSGGKFRADEFIETLSLYTFVDFEELLSFMKQAVSQFELDGLGGVVLSLYSVILSRKVECVRDDMDEPTSKLMGAHGYCTQDMVNLYISGRAVSNVFNDVMELDSGDGNVTILKGVVSRCDVGLLSLFEHYKSCQVGTYLKTPRNPIWVVCSESHFSVLFCIKKELTSDWKAEKRFDLYYYDGLARQQEEIRLTIDTNSRSLEPSSEEELIPPLEHCIRTKWEGANVDWNGTEPLL